MYKGACWKSDLDLHHRDDETESQSSTVETYGDPKDTSVGSFMHNLFLNQLYTDVEFSFKNTKECLCAHRVVLAARCEFFADLLFGEKANSVSGMKMRVDISNVPFTAFKDIVNYFYTDDIDFPNLSTALDIHSTANSFKVQSLIELCQQYLDEIELNEDNVCSTLQLSNSKCVVSLKKRCISYIKSHTLEVISSPDFEKSSFHTVREIVNLQDLNLRSESEMLEALSRWINIQPDHTKVELRKSLMKCIRFLSFTPKEFHGIIKQHPEVLMSGEALDTLIYLNDPTTKNKEGLPEWMNKSLRKFLHGHKETKTKNVGKIQIPLITDSVQNKLDRLTSFLQLKCIKGEHIIKGIIIKLEDVPNNGNTIAVIIVKAIVVERNLKLYFNKTIDSKEVVIYFNQNFLIDSGQTFNVEVEVIACQSCKFFRYDISKEDVLSNEHFQCSVASKPKQGMHYFIHEVLFDPPTQKTVPKKPECHPKVKKIRRKKKKKTKQNQETTEIGEKQNTNVKDSADQNGSSL